MCLVFFEQFLFCFPKGNFVFFCIPFRHKMFPEIIIKISIEEGTVHIEEDTSDIFEGNGEHTNSYSWPFVVGIPLILGSMDTAFLSALPSALNTASIMWCVFLP